MQSTFCKFIVSDPQDEELKEGEDYSVALYFVSDEIGATNEGENARLRQLADSVERLLTQCDGLSVVSADVYAESEITWEETNNSVRWGDFDYLSYENA